MGQAETARRHYERTLAVWEKNLGAEHPRLAHPLMRLGKQMLARKQPRQALPLLERAVKLREGAAGDPVDLAEVRFALARALWDTGERQRALALATGACDVFVARQRARNLDEVATWLKPRLAGGKNARCVAR